MYLVIVVEIDDLINIVDTDTLFAKGECSSKVPADFLVVNLLRL